MLQSMTALSYRGGVRRRVLALVWLAGLAMALPLRAQSPEAVLYRIFLTDGRTLVSFGDFARVADRVVFSMPLGAAAPARGPRLQLVTIPAGSVDWGATEQYANSARAAHYASTRGEPDFAVLSGQVAWALNEIALTKDVDRRLDLAKRARRVLGEWTRTSYGYRAQEVTELSALVDEIVSELTAAAGANRFELDFVANVAAPPPVPLMPAPTLQQSIELALSASTVTTEPAERLVLLQSAIEMLDAADGSVSRSWATSARGRAEAELAAERRTEKAYGALMTQVLDAAAVHARRADARAIEALVRRVVTTDQELGNRRPGTIASLLATLDRKLDAARRLRLARDRWALEAPVYRAFAREVEAGLAEFKRAASALEDVRALAGPEPASLTRAADRLERARIALDRVTPADTLRPLHAMLASAVQLGLSACQLRRQAIERQNLPAAWNASSAAAGALMLYERASLDLDRLLKPPDLQ